MRRRQRPLNWRLADTNLLPYHSAAKRAGADPSAGSRFAIIRTANWANLFHRPRPQSSRDQNAGERRLPPAAGSVRPHLDMLRQRSPPAPSASGSCSQKGQVGTTRPPNADNSARAPFPDTLPLLNQHLFIHSDLPRNRNSRRYGVMSGASPRQDESTGQPRPRPAAEPPRPNGPMKPPERR